MSDQGGLTQTNEEALDVEFHKISSKSVGPHLQQGLNRHAMPFMSFVWMMCGRFSCASHTVVYAELVTQVRVTPPSLTPVLEDLNPDFPSSSSLSGC